MRAAVLHEFKRPRSIEEVERPKPNQNEVLIAVEACGVCHSDMHVATLHLDIRRRYTKSTVTIFHAGPDAQSAPADPEKELGWTDRAA